MACNTDIKEKNRYKSDVYGRFLFENDNERLAILYAPPGGNVQHVAEKIKSKIVGRPVDIFYIPEFSLSEIANYNNFIVVTSTVGLEAWYNKPRDGWDYMQELSRFNMKEKRVALVGLGDHISYPKNFVDGMKEVADIVIKTGGKLVGETPAKGYHFEESKSLIGDYFIGLPIDEDYEADKTDERIEKWLGRVMGKSHI